MSGHTPGPWKLGSLDITPFGTGFSMGIDAESHGELALVVWQMEEDKIDGKPSPECEANARLIAMSPQLLLALEDAAEIFRGLADVVPVLRERVEAYDNLIAKARGEA